MAKTLNLFIILLIGFFSSPVHAQKTLKLSPNQGKVLSNSSLWTLNANCTVQVSNQSKSKIKINVIKNNCTVNGKKYTKGQTTSVTITNNSNFSVSADAGTEINLINLGTAELQAVCST